MRFWMAMKALEEGQKVRFFDWVDSYIDKSCLYDWIPNMFQKGHLDGEWELYEEPINQKKNGMHKCQRGFNVCEGEKTLVFSVHYTDTDCDGYAQDNWEEIEVKYCPFCGYCCSEETGLSFADVVKGLKEGKRFKRNKWNGNISMNTPNRVIFEGPGPLGRNIITPLSFELEDIEATDWEMVE